MAENVKNLDFNLNSTTCVDVNFGLSPRLDLITLILPMSRIIMQVFYFYFKINPLIRGYTNCVSQLKAVFAGYW